MIRLITGYAGVGHVTSADAGRFNAGVLGQNAYVLQTGDRLAYTLKSNNEISIGSGDLVDQGRHFSIPQNSSETLMIENGSQGKTRYDTVVIRYEKNSDTGVESASMYIAKGEEVSSTSAPSKPALTKGNIYNGDLIDDVPLYYIRITDLNVVNVERATQVIPSISTIADVIYPVGSIYMSMAATNPSELFGGKWTPIRDHFLIGDTKSGRTDGSKEIQILPANLPPHTHTIRPHIHGVPKHTHRVEISTAGAHTHSFSKIKQAATGTARYVPEKPGAAASSTSGTITTSKEGAHTHIATVQACAEFATAETKLITDENTGTAKPIRIMPPFLTVYMWQRTA